MKVIPCGWKGRYCYSHVLLRLRELEKLTEAYLIFNPSTCPEYSTAIFIIEGSYFYPLGGLGFCLAV